MPQDNPVLPLRMERPASVRYGSMAANNTNSDKSAATGEDSSASPPEPNSSGSRHSPSRLDTERGRARNSRHTKARSSDKDLHIVRPPPPATTPPTAGELGQAQIASGHRSLGSATRYDEKETSAPRMNPSSDGAYHRDWEKDLAGGQPPFDSHHNLPQATEHATTIFTAFSEDVEEDEDGGEEDEEAEEDGPKKHAMWILIHLSAFSPLVSLITSLYAILAILLALVVSPFYLYTTKNAITANLQRFLVPPLRLQLRLVYAYLDLDPDDHDVQDDVDVETGIPNSNSSRRPRSISSMMLILVNILSPLYSIGIAIAAWVAAGFWVTAAILGDPNSVQEKNSHDNNQDASDDYERRRSRRRRRQMVGGEGTQGGRRGDIDVVEPGTDTDDDGEMAVMTVRGWWVRWLGRGLGSG